MMEKALDTLVEKGILTKGEVGKILDFIENKEEERKAEFKKIKNMTAEERKTYFKENKPKKRNLAQELVNAGIITKTQADEVDKIFPSHRNGFKKKNILTSRKMKVVLNQLVENKKLSQEKADKILDFFNKKMEERKAYFKENNPKQNGLIKDLVDAGIITEKEAIILADTLLQFNKPLKKIN